MWQAAYASIAHAAAPADPLRVMRAVRFATRFGFTPDPAILEAASCDEVSPGCRLNNLCSLGVMVTSGCQPPAGGLFKPAG